MAPVAATVSDFSCGSSDSSNNSSIASSSDSSSVSSENPVLKLESSASSPSKAGVAAACWRYPLTMVI